jgi:tetraacyldisaccharide 4'-kinase
MAAVMPAWPPEFGIAAPAPAAGTGVAWPFALWPLLPLSWLFGAARRAAALAFRCGVLRSCRLPVPVVVVGNLTVGGSGKTPLVLWLVERLREAGLAAGIISRGYGGSGERGAPVAADSSPLRWSVMSRCCWPGAAACRSSSVATAWRRAGLAGRSPECDVIVSDDGLQHYRLQRSVEVVVFDGRGAGNGRLLPAGPLREPLRRLAGLTRWCGTVARRSKARGGGCRPALAAVRHAAGRQRFVAANG